MIEIVNSQFIKSAVKQADYYKTIYPEIAVVGKSNVGKSTLINALLNRKKIAKVSSTPGKTRLINFFHVRVIIKDDMNNYIGESFFSLTDLPGYGFAKVSKNEKEKWKLMVSTYFKVRKSLKAVLMLVDIRHNADPKDILMLDMLTFHRIPFVVIATKADKIPKNKIEKTISNLAEEIGIDVTGIIPFSSLRKDTMPALLSLIEELTT